MTDKIYASFDEAVADIPDGASIAAESWGVAATPQNLIYALKKRGTRDLTLVTHNFVPLLIFSDEEATMPTALLPQLKRLLTPVVGVQRMGAGDFVKEYILKGLEVELTSHGILASRLYAGAAGLGGIYSPVGLGTVLAGGKEKRVINGREYLFESPVTVDCALIRARKADRLGNLVYEGVYRADQPLMAMAAKVTIAEVDEIVEVGDIDPEHVVTPGIFVDRIVRIPEDGLGTPAKLNAMVSLLGGIDIARRMLFREPVFERVEAAEDTKPRLEMDVVAMRAAKELRDGDYANLGYGIPSLCAIYIPEGVIFQSENGALGYGPLITEDEIDKANWHYLAAGGRFFSPAPGMALFDVMTSFNMIRGGRMVSVMGALEVSERGDLANWNTGGDALGGTIGGGMDLAVGAKTMIITMSHTSSGGKPKIVKECGYPLTARECVDLIITDLAVIEVTPGGLILKEVAPGWTAEEVQGLTGATLIPAPDLREMEL